MMTNLLIPVFFDDEQHSATIKAVSPSQLAIIDATKLKQFLDSQQYFTEYQTG
jgi:CRP-like cAMP-binding protein